MAEQAVHEALGEVQLNEHAFRSLANQREELESVIASVVQAHVGRYQFAGERSESHQRYPSAYRGAHAMADQVRDLQALFPGIGSADERATRRPLPSFITEENGGYFAFPRWQLFAKTYNEAVLMVLQKLKATRPLNNFDAWQVDADRLCQCQRSIKMWQQAAQRQNGYDILTMPAQFGMYHRGRSMRLVRAMYEPSEFGLGLYETGIMLLTHSERFSVDPTPDRRLGIHCPGDVGARCGHRNGEGAPHWQMTQDGVLHFGPTPICGIAIGLGSATAILPDW